MSGQLSQAPVPAEHGSFLMKDSAFKIIGDGELSLTFPNPTTTTYQLTSVTHGLSTLPGIVGFLTRMGNNNTDLSMPSPAFIWGSPSAGAIVFTGWAEVYATATNVAFVGQTSFTDSYFSGVWTMKYYLLDLTPTI